MFLEWISRCVVSTPKMALWSTKTEIPTAGPCFDGQVSRGSQHASWPSCDPRQVKHGRAYAWAESVCPQTPGNLNWWQHIHHPNYIMYTFDVTWPLTAVMMLWTFNTQTILNLDKLIGRNSVQKWAHDYIGWKQHMAQTTNIKSWSLSIPTC